MADQHVASLVERLRELALALDYGSRFMPDQGHRRVMKESAADMREAASRLAEGTREQPLMTYEGHAVGLKGQKIGESMGLSGNLIVEASPRISAAERPAPTWQPIESAPQRQKVLVSWVNALGNSRTTCAAFYPAGTLELDEAPDDMLNEDGMNADDGWFECREAGDAVDWHLNEKLTYWMPLPASPRSVVAPEKE